VRRFLSGGALGRQYERALVLATPDVVEGAEELVLGMERWIETVELRVLSVTDAGDYADVARAVAGAVQGLDAEGEVDVLVSAGSPHARAVWFGITGAGVLRARLIQVVSEAAAASQSTEAIREIVLPWTGTPSSVGRSLEHADPPADLGRSEPGNEVLAGQSACAEVLRTRVERIRERVQSGVIVGESAIARSQVAQRLLGSVPSVRFRRESLVGFGHTARQRWLEGFFAEYRESDALDGVWWLDGVDAFEVDEIEAMCSRLSLGLWSERRAAGLGDRRIWVGLSESSVEDSRALARIQAWLDGLHGVVVQVPSLRDRTEDLPQMVAAIGARLGESIQVRRDAWAALLRYSWPGGLEELRTEVLRWALTVDGEVTRWALSETITGSDFGVGAAPSTQNQALSWRVARVEREAIEAALIQEQGNLVQTARVLEVDRNTLKRKMVRYGLKRSAYVEM